MKKAFIVVITVVVLAIVVSVIYLNKPSEVSNTNSAVEPALEQQEEVVDTVMVSGTVLDGMTNQPLTARITIRRSDQVIATTECNQTGAFSLSLEDGSYEISAEYPGYIAKGRNDISHALEVNSENVAFGSILLWPAAQIKGRVVTNDQGLESKLTFSYEYDDSGARYYKFDTISTDDSGNFTLKQAYGGIQDIEIESDGFVSQKLTDIEVTPGQTVDLGDIPMIMGITVFGVVTDAATNKAIEGATLKYADFKRKILVETKSGADGSFILPATAMNKFKLVAAADGYNNSIHYIVSNNQPRYELNVALSVVPGNEPQPTQAASKKAVPSPMHSGSEYEDNPEADATAEKLFKANERAFQEAMEIKLSDAPEDADMDQYLQSQLIQKAAATQEAVQQYSNIITEGNSAQWSIASLVRIGMLYQSVADELMATQAPPGLPEDIEEQYLNLVHLFAIQFMEREVTYYEEAVKQGEAHHITNEFIQSAEKQLSLQRYNE